MLRVQKNLVAHLLQQGFKNNGLFSPIEIKFMAHVNKAESPNDLVKSSEHMAVYLIGQSFRQENYLHKWTAASSMFITIKLSGVLVEDAKGVCLNYKDQNPVDPYYKAFHGDQSVYDIQPIPIESAEYDWPTVLYKVIRYDPVRDFVQVYYKQKFGKNLVLFSDK